MIVLGLGEPQKCTGKPLNPKTQYVEFTSNPEHDKRAGSTERMLVKTPMKMFNFYSTQTS